MWTKEYQRNQLPIGMDHGSFGESCPSLRFSDPEAQLPIPRNLVNLKDCVCPASALFDSNGVPVSNLPSFLQSCTATFSAAHTDPLRSTVFFPDQAVLLNLESKDFLFEESTWHSHLYYSEYFRNDYSTQWKWRVNRNWVVEETVNEPINLCYHRFYYQYFHWFMDVLPRVWLLDRYNSDARSARWCVAPNLNGFRRSSLKLFGIEERHLYWPDANIVEFTRATHTAFQFSEPLRTRPSYNEGLHHKGWSIEYLLDLCDRAWQAYNVFPHNGPRRIYVSREDAEHRKVRNEATIIQMLEQIGFTIVIPGSHTFEEQVRLFSKAEIVVGVHGAGLTNLLWTKPGATVVEIMPERLDDPGYRFLCNLKGHRHQVMLAEHFVHDRYGDAYGDAAIDESALLSIIKGIL